MFVFFNAIYGVCFYAYRHQRWPPRIITCLARVLHRCRKLDSREISDQILATEPKESELTQCNVGLKIVIS